MAKRSKRKKITANEKSATASAPAVAAAPQAAAAPQQFPRPGRDWILGLSLILAVLLVYQPAWRAGFVWDDETVVTLNPVIAGPLGLREIWTTPAADICPFTLTTFWAEYKLWGAAPLPYHLVNIFLHGLCAVVLWRVLRRLRIPGAWLGAALWALHPVEVESVAWVTEMKNTESGLFFLLSISFYVRDLDESPSGIRRAGGWNWNYALTLLFAALAMASKSSTVVLPLVLCLCAWWREGRWEWRHLAKMIPLFVMSIGAGLATLWTQKLQVATLLDAQWDRSWLERVATAGDAIWFYLGKLLWPFPLMTIYPRWDVDAGRVTAYLALMAAVILLSMFWFNRKTWARPWLFAFVFFLVALLPVVGFLNNTFFRFSFVADHFQYLASIAPLALAGAGIVRMVKVRWQTGVSAGILVLFGILSWRQASIYKTEQSLWNYTLAWNPQCWLAQNGLGVALVAEGKTEEGIAHYHEALRLNPNYVDDLYNLGVALDLVGRSTEAMAAYQKAISINPGFAKAHNNIGFIVGRSGRTDEAIIQFKKAIEINPDYAEARYNLGVALFQKGERDESVAELQMATKIKPDYIGAYTSLGVAFAQMGRTDEAAAQFRKILEINPNDADAHNNLAIALSQLGRTDEAISQYEAALKIKPDSDNVRDNLGTLLLNAGRIEEATVQFQEALRRNPADTTAQKNLSVTKGRMDQDGDRKH